MPEPHATLPVADLPPGTVQRVMLNDEPVAVCNVDGRFYAIHDRCTHADAPLSPGGLEGCHLVCTWHGATFDVRTGQPTSPPASEPCRRYTVERQGDTLIVIDRVPND